MCIEVKSVSFRYPKEPEVLVGINLHINTGEVVALMGSSGSGKSTLVKIISSFLKPSTGQIFVNAETIKFNRPHREISYVSQFSLKTLFPWKTVEENIYYPNKLRKCLDSATKMYCDTLLAKLKIAHKRKSFPLSLSGGEQKRLALGVALSYKPKIILLDEAFSGLDFGLAQELWQVLHEDFQLRKPTVLLVTHSFDEATVLAGKVIFLNSSKSLLHAEKTANDFDLDNSVSRCELIMQSNAIEYRNYLLKRFNATAR